MKNSTHAYKEETLSIEPGNSLKVFINYLQKTGPMVEPHWHDFYEILYIVDGRCAQAINGVSQDMGNGDIVVIEPGDTHATYSLSESGCMIIVIQFFAAALNFDSTPVKPSKYLSAFLNGADLKSGYLLVPYPHEQEMKRLTSKINEEFTLADTGYQLVVKGLIFQFLGYLNRSGQSTLTDQQNDTLFDKVMSACTYIEQNYQHRLTLAGTAAHLGYSPEHLSRLFKRVTGKTFKSYVDFVKIAEARRLLQNENLTIGEIADLLGYDNIGSFSRAFSRICHVPPSRLHHFQQQRIGRQAAAVAYGSMQTPSANPS